MENVREILKIVTTSLFHSTVYSTVFLDTLLGGNRYPTYRPPYGSQYPGMGYGGGSLYPGSGSYPGGSGMYPGGTGMYPGGAGMYPGGTGMYPGGAGMYPGSGGYGTNFIGNGYGGMGGNNGLNSYYGYTNRRYQGGGNLGFGYYSPDLFENQNIQPQITPTGYRGYN